MAKNDPRSGNCLPRSVGLIQGFSSLRPEEQKVFVKIIPKDEEGGASDSKLGAQSKKLHEILDALQELTNKELGELATLNEYPTQKLRVSSTLLQLCADGILFGATTPCEVCKESGRSGRILLDGEVYRCTGWLTEHLRCSFQTQEPERQVWQLTPRAKQLQKLAKMKLKVGQRLFSTKISEDAPAPSQSSSTVQCKPPLLNLSVYLSKGFSKEKREELADMVKGHMGSIATSLAKGVCFVVSSEELMKKETKEVEVQIVTAPEKMKRIATGHNHRDTAGYYTKIDGVNLDAAIIEACEAAVKGKGDGRVSVEDAQEVFKFVKDAGKVTETELWTMRYCLTEYNFTEAASDWITNAVKGITKYADKVAKGKKISGYYEKVDGVQCDHEVLEVCRKAVAGAGDGRVSKEDAKLVLAAVTDGGKVTQTEKWTLRLCLSEFNWTEAAQDWFAEELKAFTSAKKRPSSAPGRPAKKVKTVDNGKKVKSVLGSLKVLEKSEKADVLSMVSSMGQKTLAVPKEERHSFQSDAFKMVEKLLNDAHVVLQNQLAAAKELIDNSDAEKAKREAAVKAAEEALTASKAGKEKAMEKNQEKSTALKAAEDALKSAQTQQKDGDAKAVSLEKEKAALEEGTKDWMGELRKAEKGWTGEGWQLAMTRL
ncbi:Poly [ADP-ribose] polymerase 1 (PARP-1) (ADP-ribosyltransferase diphtheria toxin-like 1) (ARTD1) (DNA ADP-ribosyltransferase PARP1) (NAD(+) ADP-ribosyltransferase 1) (ADPRT 1) (Poly[ADP-ribose] synthase 1) (Protein poly-ADP-ribosyltransferase PARP1), partial [Durusdinium trenchii]